MRRKILKDIFKGCLPIATAVLLGLLACLVLSLCSCRSGRETQVERVEVPVVVTQEHTVESVKIDHVRDTLIQRDSVYHYVQGDTVLIEKWHYLQGSTKVLRGDTVHIIDSVPYPVPVEKTITKIEEIEKPLMWWQEVLMWCGFVLLCFIGWKIVRLSR